MRLDKLIKNKFIYTKKSSIIKKLYFFFHYLKLYYYKSYSQGGVDLLVNKFFKNQKNGIYLDIGAYHPIKWSNTYLLYKKGWSGINIDLDESSIEMFKYFRTNDYNKQIAVSNYKGNINLYRYHQRSAVQTVSSDTARKMNNDNLKKIEVKCDTLNNIIQDSCFKNMKIDFLSIDIEGHELIALKDFDFKKYDPKLIVIEYNDPELVSFEFQYQKIENVMKSEIYKFMYEKNYKFVNWHHTDLIFISDKIFKQRKVNF